MFTETDPGKELHNSIFRSLLKNNNLKHYSRNSSVGAVFAKTFNRTIGDLPRRPNFEKGDGNWIDVPRTITKQFSFRTH